MADDLSITLKVDLDEGSLSGVQDKINGITKEKDNKIKLKLDTNINKQISNLKSQLNDISGKVYPIKFQIDTSTINSIQNLTNSLNQAFVNVQRNIGQIGNSLNVGNISGGYTGTSKLIQRGKIDELGQFEATSEIEKQNLALGERLTIFRELKKEQDEEIGRMEETSRQYETNYEEQAKAAKQAYDQQIKEEAKYRTYVEKENEKALKEQNKIQEQQKREEEKAQKERERNSSMYAGLYDQIDRKEAQEEKKARDYDRREREKAAKEEERLIKQQQREQEKLQANRDREQSSLSSFFIGKGEDTDRTIANWKSKIEDLYTDAFKLENPLTGEFAKPVDEAITTIRQKVSDLEDSGVLVTSKMKDQINSEIKAIGRLYEEQYDKNYPDTKQKSVDTRESVDRYTSRLNKAQNELQQMGMLSDQLKANIDEVRQGFASVGQEDGDSLGQWVDKFGTLQQKIAEFKSSVEGQSMKLDFEIESNQLSQIDSLTEKLNSLPESLSGSGVAAAKEELATLATEYKNVITQLQGDNLTQEQFNALAQKAEELDSRLKQVANSAKIFNDGFKNSQDIQKYEQKVSGIQDNFEKLERTYEDLAAKNPEIAQRFEDVRNSIQNIDPMNVTEVSSEVTNLAKACSNAAGESSGLRGALSNAFGGVGQYLARFTSAFYIINKGIQTVKSMVNEVKSLDTSLVELQKVTNLSGESLTQFTDNAYKTGKEVGRTGKDVIDAVTTFSRAGYNLEESNQLAKAALTMTNVGVDIPNTEAAASDMISILKAFDKQANESMQVIDKLYNVANKEPLDFGNITEMLVTAGGTLAQTNTSLEESMGLLTGGFATLRNSSVANGLIQISQRLRGVREDGEAIEEEGFMPKLKKAFGDAGVAIEDQNGELRSTYDILHDLARQWDTLSSKQRQYLGEKAAGTRQVKVLNAIMANWDVVEDTIQKANEATGEATKGNEKYLDSIEGRIIQFKSAFSDLSRTIVDSELVKFLVGAGTNLLTGLTSIVDRLKSTLAPVGKSISRIFDEIGRSASKSYAFKSYSNELEETKDKLSSQKDVVADLNTQLQDTQSRIEELNSKESLTIVEKTELDNLKELNNELKATIQLEEARKNIQQNGLRQSANEALVALEEKPAEDFSKSFNSKRQNEARKAIEKSGSKWVQDFLTDIANIPNMRTFKDESGEPIALDYTSFFNQAVNAYNSMEYVQSEYLKTKESILKVSEDVLSAQTETEKNAALEELDTLKNRSAYLEEYKNENLAIIESYSEQLHEITDGLAYTETPAENDVTSKNINNAKDLAKLLDKMIVTSQIDSIDDASDYVTTQFGKEIDSIKSIIEKNGEISYDRLISDFPEVLSAFEEYGGRFGLVGEKIAEHINQMFKQPESGIDEDISSVIKDLISQNYLASESYKTLSTAMTEQQKSGLISIETYQKLIESDEKLANALTLTADGYALNSDAVNEYVQAKTDEQKVQALLAYDEQNQKLEELKKRYEELSNATIKTDDVIKELAQNQDAQNAAERNMEAIAAYVRELDAATGALARFKAAQSSANEDANFQDSKTVLKIIQEGNKTGKRNIDDYQYAVNYVLGDNWKKNLKEFGDSVDKAYKEAEKKSKRYSGQKDEKTGLRNFMKDVGATDFGTYDSKTGKLTLSEGVTLDQLATELKMSKDYVADLFKAINTYAEEGEGFTFPEFFTDDEKKQAEERKKALKENEKAQEQMGNKVEDVNKQIEAANERGDEKEAQRLEQEKKRLEDSQKVLEQEHANIENGVEMDVDTMTLEDAKKKIDELYETISALNGAGIDIPVTIADSYNTLLETFPQLRSELQNPLPPINVKMTGDALPKLVIVDGKVKQLEGDHFVDVDVDDNGTADDVKSKVEDVEDGIYSAKVDAELGNDTATGDIESIANSTYPSAKVAAESDAASINTTKAELDDLSKDRTVTYKVKYTKEAEEGEKEFGEWFENDLPVADQNLTNIEKTETTQEKTWGQMWKEAWDAGAPVEETVEVPVEVEPKIENDGGFDWIDDWNENVAQDDTATVDIQTEASNPEEPIQQVQDTANGTPVELQFDFGDLTQLGALVQSLTGSAENAGVGNTSEGAGAISDLRQAYIELSNAMEKAKDVDIGDASGAEQAASEIQNAANNFMTAYNTLSTMTSSLTVEPIEVDADTTTALQKVQAIGDKGVTVNVSANTTSASNSIDALGNKVVTVTVQAQTTGFAKGTKNAPNGPSLVDENGAELIEHTRQGTYELGTNNGPRITNLESGDVVHTASETKKILSRAAKVGGFFRDGLNKAKSIITGMSFSGGVAGSASLGGDLSSTKKSSKKKSSKKSSKSKKSGKTNMKKLRAWFEKLFDWAEIRLERLQTITNEWIYNAGQAIGYAAQNTQLANAMASVENQIRDTTAAYNLYIAQADKVAKKTKLSADIINRIQNGTIEISSYDKKTQEKIKMYQTWYDKAIACKEALQDLNEQEQELAKNRLDNIITHYTNRANVYENIVKQREAQMNLAEAQGREQFASDYNTSITATNNKLNTLVQERAALNNEFNSLVAKGYIKKDSDAWFEYSEKIRDLDTEIITVKNDIIDLHDAANQVNLTKLGYQLDALTNSASHVDEMISLHSAQAIDEYADNYKKLIDNGMDQIKNLQAQNVEYRKQQQGLDKMSAKYQELESSIQSNISAINQMKVSQEGWNDSVYDIQIGKIEDFKDQLSKTNELYERQKNLQDAIRELEKAQGQRTQRVFREGQGFVFEADQEALRDAQESLEDVIQDELMSKLDDLIDALEESKNNSNIYDANGNLLGTKYVIPQLDNLSQVLSNYYSNPNTAPSVDAIRKLFMDELVSSNTTSSQNQVSMSIGDIILNEVNNGNDLANAIINQLPNALLQAIYKK